MKKILLLMCAVVISWSSFAQDVTVSGTVTSTEDGSALPGVNVLLKGTTNGTATDANGKYSLSIPASGGALIFSFIGLKGQEIEINGRSTIDISLALDATELSEVVVTALGIERTKNALPYSAQKVDGSQIAATRDNNFVNSLSGKVAGLSISKNNNMGGSTNVVIRGSKSLTGNNQALFVVDGVPVDNSNTNGANQQTGRGGYDYGNAAADINPDNIESLTVLKGAAATALYGSRAANGVIMITTKKSKAKKGIGVTVNTGVTIGMYDKDTFAKYQNKYGEGYGAYYEDPTGFFLNRDVDGNGTNDLVTPTSEDASWGAPFDPTLMVYKADAFDPFSDNYQKASPWVAAKNGPSSMFETAVSQNYSVLLDGASDRGYYKIGYTFTNDKGIMPNSHIDKDYINLGGSYKIAEKLTSSIGMNISNIKGQGRYGTGYDDKNLMTNFRQWWPVSVDVQDQKKSYFRSLANQTWNWADPSDLVPIYWDNPYFTRYQNFEDDQRLRYFGYTSVNYKIADWVEVMGRISLDSYNEAQQERQAFGSVTVPSYSRFNRIYHEYNYDVMANFNKDINESLNLKAVIGTNIRRTKIESINVSTNGGLVIPKLYAISNSLNPINPPTEFFSELGVNGVYASLTLGYKNMLFLDLTDRRDQSSSLPKDNNSYLYPAASMSFVFSELLNNLTWLNGGKLRANYAEVGSPANPNNTKDTYFKPVAFGSVPLFSVPSQKNNNQLVEERSKSFELGLEMSFFDARAGFDVTFYKTNSINQIMPVPVTRSTGYDSKVLNSGEIENKGIELTIYGSPIKTDNFIWTINLNWTRNRNQVVDLAPGINDLQLGAFQGGVTINAALGQPYGTIRGTDFVYTNGQKTVITSGGAAGSYQISSTANNIIGNINPDWIGGINNSFKFKNFNFSFLVDMKRGGDVFSLDMFYGLATGLYPETAGLNEFGNPVRSAPSDFTGGQGGLLLPGVKPDGTPNDIRYNATNFGIYGYRRNPAAAFVYDASYIKLREVVLTYSLPQLLVSKLALFKSIDLSVVGRNLWIISKNLPYADPEDGLSSGNLSQGYQVGSYPNVRNIGFNAKFKF